MLVRATSTKLFMKIKTKPSLPNSMYCRLGLYLDEEDEMVGHVARIGNIRIDAKLLSEHLKGKPWTTKT
jgi:hypothetical protein